MTTITLNWETQNGQYKQDFDGLNIAMKEMSKVAKGSDKTSIVIVDKDSNWDLVIRSNEEVYYIAKEGSTCKSGYYGTIGHLRHNIRLGYNKTKLK